MVAGVRVARRWEEDLSKEPRIFSDGVFSVEQWSQFVPCWMAGGQNRELWGFCLPVLIDIKDSDLWEFIFWDGWHHRLRAARSLSSGVDSYHRLRLGILNGWHDKLRDARSLSFRCWLIVHPHYVVWVCALQAFWHLAHTTDSRLFAMTISCGMSICRETGRERGWNYAHGKPSFVSRRQEMEAAVAGALEIPQGAMHARYGLCLHNWWEMRGHLFDAEWEVIFLMRN